MVVSNKGKGKGSKGSKGLVRHADKKPNVLVQKSVSPKKGGSKGGNNSKGNGKKGGKGSGKGNKGSGKSGPPAEKRIDPSDGNGPFSFASFVRYHGEDKAKVLWKQAGEGGNNKNKQGNNKVDGGAFKQNNNATKVTLTKKSAVVNNPFVSDNEVKKNNSASKKGGEQNNKKGAGKKGKGKGKGQQGPPQEKRIDPSDGNGPFTKASFIRFHGEEKGLMLWEQAGEEA